MIITDINHTHTCMRVGL